MVRAIGPSLCVLKKAGKVLELHIALRTAPWMVIVKVVLRVRGVFSVPMALECETVNIVKVSPRLTGSSLKVDEHGRVGTE
jgi:hypothetical protein